MPLTCDIAVPAHTHTHKTGINGPIRKKTLTDQSERRQEQEPIQKKARKHRRSFRKKFLLGALNGRRGSWAKACFVRVSVASHRTRGKRDTTDKRRDQTGSKQDQTCRIGNIQQEKKTQRRATKTDNKCGAERKYKG
jgi:hypothetical protein